MLALFCQLNMRSPLNIASKWINTAIIVFYAVGTVGLLLEPSKMLFLQLVPWFLCFMLFLLLMNHPGFTRKQLIWFLLTFLLGFSAEWIGVHTGYLFGDYHYGPTLGLKFDGIPLVIGVNWLLLAYCSWDLAGRIFSTNYLRVPIGAALMTFLDFFIEPVAIKLDFWTWNAADIPWTNYLGWFLVACVILSIARFLKIEFTNRSSTYLYLSMFLFFVLLNSIG